jgi:hypothetical protein
MGWLRNERIGVRPSSPFPDLFIVIPCLEKIDSVGGDFIDQAMLLSNSPAPAAGLRESQRLGFADAREWVSEHGFHQFQNAERRLAIVFDEPD